MDFPDNLKCPKCGGKLKSIGGNTKSWLFLCLGCNKEVEIEDKGFGYLPMRVESMKEAYP